MWNLMLRHLVVLQRRARHGGLMATATTSSSKQARRKVVLLRTPVSSRLLNHVPLLALRKKKNRPNAHLRQNLATRANHRHRKRVADKVVMSSWSRKPTTSSMGGCCSNALSRFHNCNSRSLEVKSSYRHVQKRDAPRCITSSFFIAVASVLL